MSDFSTMQFQANVRTVVLQLLDQGVMVHIDGQDVRRRLGTTAVERTEISFPWRPEAEALAVQLVTRVLAHQLPTEVVHDMQTRQVEFAHFRSWWDHFKASYRGRWWMRWRTWEVHYKIEIRRLTAKLTVNLERFHTFPAADLHIPDGVNPLMAERPIRGLGPAVNVLGPSIAGAAWHEQPTTTRDEVR